MLPMQIGGFAKNIIKMFGYSSLLRENDGRDNKTPVRLCTFFVVFIGTRQ